MEPPFLPLSVDLHDLSSRMRFEEADYLPFVLCLLATPKFAPPSDVSAPPSNGKHLNPKFFLLHQSPTPVTTMSGAPSLPPPLMSLRGEEGLEAHSSFLPPHISPPYFFSFNLRKGTRLPMLQAAPLFPSFPQSCLEGIE